jgi:hypothetical protein
VLVTAAAGGTTAVTAPLPADAISGSSANLTAPVCPSAGTCLVLGIYQTTSQHTGFLLLRGYGSSWTVSALPTLGGALLAVPPELACGPTGCAVAGTYQDGASGATHVMLVTGDPTTDGSAWTPRQAPAPAGAAGGTLGDGVSVGCGAAGCAVVSRYADTAGASHPYLITGSGAIWSAADAPLPDGDSAPDGNANLYALSIVSCGPAACAVTGYHQAGTDVRPVLLTGNDQVSGAPTP